MRLTSKPVRKCRTCPMNLGETCWLFKIPRLQWRIHGGKCRAFENREIISEFEKWRKQPDVKSRKELRRKAFRTIPKTTKHTRQDVYARKI